MGEKVGFMMVLLIFGIGVIPLLFSAFSDQVQTSKMLTTSTEIQQLVTAEGGVTPKVNEVASYLEQQGLKIKFVDKNNNPVNGKVPVGQEVYMHYKYGSFETSNKALIQKR